MGKNDNNFFPLETKTFFLILKWEREIRKIGKKRGDFLYVLFVCQKKEGKARQGKKMFHSFTDSTHDIHKVNRITIVAERYLI